MPSHRRIGGGSGHTSGLPVNNIESFLPSLVPDIALWIKADTKYIKEETIESYANKQSYFIKEAILEQFKLSLDSKVITEIVSDTPATPNSFIPLNLDNNLATVFPTFRVVPNELDAINISNYKEPITEKQHRLQLITAKPVTIDGSSSTYTISHGFTISQNTITNQIILTPEYIETPVADLQEKASDAVKVDPNDSILAAHIEPTAEISELILYSRVLTSDENAKLEGYLAYKQNTQYALPLNHPYLPNMIRDPLFADISQQLKKVDDTLRQTVEYITVAINDYVNEKGDTGPTFNASSHKKAIQVCLQNHANIIQILSKGYLYARKINSLTLDSIYKIIEEKKWFMDLNASTIKEVVANAEKVNTDANDFIKSLMQTYSQPFVQQGGANVESQVQISDHVLFENEATASNTFYQELRTHSATLRLNGTSAYNTLQNALKNDITPIIDTILHQWSDIQTKNNLLTDNIAPIKTSILNETWLTYLPDADTAYLPILKGSVQISKKYNDPALNLIQTYYTYVEKEMKQGDYAYIMQEFKAMRDLFTSFSLEELNPVFKATYINYLSRHVAKAADYYKEFLNIHTELSKYLENINSFIAVAKETGQPSTFPERVDETSKYKSILSDIYIRKVINLDTTLFGLEYVETDSNGVIPETHIIPFYPKYVKYIFMNGIYKKQTVYLNDDDTPLEQIYHIVGAFSESVYRGLTDTQKPALHMHSLSSLTEISRSQVNAIHCIESVGSIMPILLPLTAIPKNAWYLIYNIGEIPIVVRSSDKTCDSIGYMNGILYMYNDVDANYLSYPWCKDQLPYDNLLGLPRTSLSMYIDELGTSIYIRKGHDDTYEPVYTSDGYLVEVVKTDDGSVYDIDDVYKSNPYNVTSVSVNNRTKLILNPSMKKMVKMSSNILHVAQDLRTGFGILLAPNGIIGVNEFGYAKAVKMPIQLIDKTYKIRGSYGDILINPSSAKISTPYEFEPFINFNNIFRTRFVSPVNNQYIFVTNSLNPIVSPSGIIIQVPPLSGTGPIWYSDSTGQNEVTLVNSISNIQTGISIYNSSELADNSQYLNLKLRYANSKKYIQSEIENMKICENEIKPFGEGAVTLCNDASTNFQTFLSTLQANDSIIESDTMPTSLAFTNVTKSIQTTMTEFFVKQQDVNASIQAYRQGLKEIKYVKDSVNYWNTDGSSAMDVVLRDINIKVQAYLNQNGITSVQSLDDLLKSSLDAQTQFNETLQTCVNYILNPPTLISEVRSWYTYIQPNLDQLKSLYEDVLNTRNIELPRVIKNYSKNIIYTALAEKIQALFATIQTTWSQIQSKKTALDTYLQLHQATLSPEQLAAKQAKITDYDNRIMQGDIKFNRLFKQVKTQPSTEQLYSLVQEFQKEAADLQTAMNSI